MEKNFEALGIIPPILLALEEMGFETPTQVQQQAIPYILDHKDLIVISKTGSGKTAVFGVSLLQLIDPQVTGPQALILTPTRELAVQVDSDLQAMAAHLQLKTTAVYGQHNINTEIRALESGVSIVTGTPGRVFDHIRRKSLTTRNIKYLVLDEADRMLDMGFFDQVRRIIRTLPRNRTTLLFSATIPEEIRRLCQDNMKNPATIEIESPVMTVETTQQVYYRVKHNEKNTQLNRLLLFEQPESCVIFCNTRLTVDRVQSSLTRKGYASRSLHGDIPQTKRMSTLQQFKQGEFHLLVATDVAARGIHIDDLSLVINYDVPFEMDGYVHRIGRTGRAGNVGRAISLVTGDDIMSLYEIEEHIGTLIEEAELPSDDFFQDNQEAITKWKQANALRSRPRQSAGTKAPGEQRKRSSSRTRQDVASGEQRKRSPSRPRQDYASGEQQKRSSSRPRQDAGINVSGEKQIHSTSQPQYRERSSGERTQQQRRTVDSLPKTNSGRKVANHSGKTTTETWERNSTGQRQSRQERPAARNQKTPAQTVTAPLDQRPGKTQTSQPLSAISPQKETPKKSLVKKVWERLFNRE